MNLYALVAFRFLFDVAIIVGNIILAKIVISGGLTKQRSFLLLLNFAVADVIFAICFFVETLRIAVPALLLYYYRAQPALSIIDNVLPSVVQTSLVLVNVSYVLETRKEHARLNGSRLVAGLMVASPWLYALLVVTPLAASPLGYTVSMVTGELYSSPVSPISILLVSSILPGFFACIATTLAVVSYVTRDRQEGNDQATSGGDTIPMHDLSSTQRGGNSDRPQDVTSAAPGTAYDITAEQRPPKAEVVYTALSVALLQLTIYIKLGADYAVSSSDATANAQLDAMANAQLDAMANPQLDAMANPQLAAIFISLFRPAIFCWLWMLRPEFKMASNQTLCCGRNPPVNSN